MKNNMIKTKIDFGYSLAFSLIHELAIKCNIRIKDNNEAKTIRLNPSNLEGSQIFLKICISIDKKVTMEAKIPNTVIKFVVLVDNLFQKYLPTYLFSHPD